MVMVMVMDGYFGYYGNGYHEEEKTGILKKIKKRLKK